MSAFCAYIAWAERHIWYLNSEIARVQLRKVTQWFRGVLSNFLRWLQANPCIDSFTTRFISSPVAASEVVNSVLTAFKSALICLKALCAKLEILRLNIWCTCTVICMSSADSPNPITTYTRDVISGSINLLLTQWLSAQSILSDRIVSD